MLKAVNKLVLEINNTENQYFEKAILFVRPEKTGADNTQLQAGAKEFLSSVCNEKCGGRKRRGRIPLGITLAGAAGAGATVMGVIMAVAKPF